MGRYQGLLNPTQGSAGGVRKLFDSNTGNYTKIGNNEYPVNISWSSCGWYASGSVGGVTVYLCDENGGNQILLFQETWAGGNHNTAAGSKTINARDLRGKVLALYIVAANSASQGTVLNVSGDTAGYAYQVTVGTAEGGTASASPTSAAPGSTVSLTATPNTGYEFVQWITSPALTITNNAFTMPSRAVMVTPVFRKITYTITRAASPAAGGTVTAPGSAAYGDRVEISQAAATGYTFAGWTLSQGTILGDYFIMPAANVNLTAAFDRNAYVITAETEPAGAGTVAVAGTAGYGDSVAVSQTPAEGYAFEAWEITGGIQVVSGAFTMPDGPVTVKAKYYKLTTGEFDSNELMGGTTAILTAHQDSEEYDHSWMLDFSSVGTMGAWVGGGPTTRVEIEIPTWWANFIPNDTEMTGGTLTITTKRYGVTLGQTVIMGLTYRIPTDAKPTMGTVTKSVLCTVDGETYASAGSGIYVQNHCGIQVAVGTCTPKYGASIASIRVRILGYSGVRYDRTYTGVTSCTFESGLLTEADDMATIEVTVTDSRGLKALLASTFKVWEYAAPKITEFEAWRVDSAGDADPDGEYGQYEFEETWTNVGSNARHAELTVMGDTEDVTAANKHSGWLLPSDRKNLSNLHGYEVRLRVYDLFEEDVRTEILDSGNFMLHFSADGTSVAVGHATTKTPHTGFTGTFEVDGDLDFYYGNLTLKEYIQGVINGTI